MRAAVPVAVRAGLMAPAAAVRAAPTATETNVGAAYPGAANDVASAVWAGFFCGYHSAFVLSRDIVLAKPNYSFEKRQRDLEKKRKQEEKRLRKLAGKKPADDDAAPDAETPAAEEQDSSAS